MIVFEIGFWSLNRSVKEKDVLLKSFLNYHHSDSTFLIPLFFYFVQQSHKKDDVEG